jgi:hypothetical protein
MDGTITGKKKILAAVRGEAKPAIRRFFDGRSVLIFADTASQAFSLLDSDKFDLILCSVHFDESKSLELLRKAKQTSVNADTPFVMIRVGQKINRPLPPAMSSSIGLAVRELGGNMYADVPELTTKMTLEEAVARVKNDIAGLLS